MANTFFGFDTAFNNDNHLLPDDDGDLGEGEEDEYDALNDETFGTLGDSALNDDWEEQHQQYACYDENSKHSEHIENSIRDLVLNDSDDDDLPTIKKKAQTQAAWYSQPLQQPPPYQQLPSNIMQQQLQFAQQQQQQQLQQQPKNGSVMPPGKLDFPNIPTVEEIEKMYANSKLQFPQQPHQNQQQKRPPPPVQLPPGQPLNRFPPGFHPLPNAVPPGPQPPPRALPPGIQPPLQGPRMPPGFPPGMRPPPAPPGGGQFPIPPMMRPGGHGIPPGMSLNMPPFAAGGPGFPNFPLPPTIRNGPPPTPAQLHQMRQHQNMMHMHHIQQQQRHHMHMNHPQQIGQNNRPPGGAVPPPAKPKDEYDGLMNNREKQWLLNIQHLQLNTGTPYFDDYYYTVFKERQARNDKENQQMAPRHNHHQPHQRHRTHSERSNENNQLQARTYTPLQFENSLGKLQCVSVTAPRKIIDTDVVTLEKDADGGTPARDTRKTKQLLLDLESLYALTLRAEDLRNPLAIANMEKLVELRQKQRLREMDAAATPEAKRELLRLLQVESAPTTETPGECVLRIMAGLLQEEKFASFMNIRKGKMLLLRLLPMLGGEYTPAEYATLWCRVLLCIPLVGRRDTAGDNLLPRLHPYFKRFVQTSRMQDILGIVGKLEQSMRSSSESRGTPLSHMSKAPLQFVVSNKFGVSALVTILVRTEYLISAGNASAPQIDDWAHFLASWADATAGRSMMATPLEVIPRPVFLKHVARFPRFGDDKRMLLERHYVDIN